MGPHPQYSSQKLLGPAYVHGPTVYRTPAAITPLFTSLCATIFPLTMKTTDDAVISPLCSLSQMIRGFDSHLTSEKNISVRADWLCQSGRAPSEPSETPWWQITPRPASRPRVASQIALRSPFRSFVSLCRSPILNQYPGVVANCDYTSDWVHWVHACIGIAMPWVTLQKSHLAFLLH